MASNQLNTELLITAGVDGIDRVQHAVRELDNMGETTSQLRDEANRLRREWDNLTPDEQAQGIRSLAEAYNNAQEQNQRLNRESERSVGVFGRMKGAVVALGAALGVAFAVGKIKDFFVSAVSGAADLEQQLATVKAVSGATADEIAKIKAKAEELGASTRFTATEAAQGFETLARAGLNAEQSIQTLPSVLALAQGNSLELAEAAGYITKAINGMGLSFDDAGRVADVLAAAASNANTDVQGMGEALSYAAPVAHSLGLSIEETAAYIGKFADAGIDASRAGTAFNSILSQFKNPASKFKQELSAIGITTKDFNEAVYQLAQSGAVGQQAILALGMEAGPAFTALLGQGTQSLYELMDTIESAGGISQRQAAEMDNTWQGALAGLRSAWEGFKNTLGESFLDGMADKFRRLGATIREALSSGKVKELGNNLARIFDELSEKVIRFVETLDFGAAIDAVNSKLEGLKEVSKGVNGAFQALNIAFQAVKSGLATIAGALSGLAEMGALAFETLVKGAAKVAKAFGADGLAKSLEEFRQGIEEDRKALHQFSEFMGEVSTNAGQSMVESLHSIAGTAETTTAKLAEVPKTFAESVQAQTQIMKDALTSYGITAESSAMAVNDSVKQIMSGLSAPEQFAALEQQITALGVRTKLSAELNAELMQKSIDTSVKATESATTAVKHYYNEEEAAAIRAKQAQEKAAAEAAQAQIKAAQEAKAAWSEFGIDVDAVTTGISASFRDSLSKLNTAMAASAQAGTQSAKVIKAAFSNLLDTAKTKEEFTALNNAIRQTGQASKLTAEQQKALQLGIAGGSKAITEHKDKTEAATKAQKEAAKAIRDTNKALEEQKQSTKSAATAIDESTKAEEKAAKATKERKIRTYEFGSTADEVYSGATNAANQSAEASKTAAEQMAQVTQSAKDTVSGLQQELMQLRGETEKLAQLQQKQKENELKSKASEALASGNTEAYREYQKALQLQKQIYAEKQNQERQKNKTPAVKADSTVPADSSKTDTDALVNAFAGYTEAQMQAAKAQARQELMNDLTDSAKRLST